MSKLITAPTALASGQGQPWTLAAKDKMRPVHFNMKNKKLTQRTKRMLCVILMLSTKFDVHTTDVIFAVSLAFQQEITHQLCSSSQTTLENLSLLLDYENSHLQGTPSCLQKNHF